MTYSEKEAQEIMELARQNKERWIQIYKAWKNGQFPHRFEMSDRGNRMYPTAIKVNKTQELIEAHERAKEAALKIKGAFERLNERYRHAISVVIHCEIIDLWEATA